MIDETPPPMQPLKFQTDARNKSILIYSRSTAIFEEISDPKKLRAIRMATGIRGPLQKKYFSGTIDVDGKLWIDTKTGELKEDW